MSEEKLEQEVVEETEECCCHCCQCEEQSPEEAEKKAKKKAKKAKKEEKKLQKDLIKQERLYLLKMLEEKFELVPNVELTKKEKTVLETVNCLENVNFFEICDFLDVKPSKLDDTLTTLIAFGLVDYQCDDDNFDTYVITEDGHKFLTAPKVVKKSEKKFREFMDCLSRDELVEFADLCGAIITDDPADQPEAE